MEQEDNLIRENGWVIDSTTGEVVGVYGWLENGVVETEPVIANVLALLNPHPIDCTLIDEPNKKSGVYVTLIIVSNAPVPAG